MNEFRQEPALNTQWMNAAGMMGFTPNAAVLSRWRMAEPQGAFVTNPISLAPRSPAADRSLIAYPGGALLHSGLPNPGLTRVLRAHAARWAQSPLPIWAHLIGQEPEEIYQMARRLEGVEGVATLEIGIPPDLQGNDALAFAQAAAGELPVVISAPLTAAGEAWLKGLPGLGVSALALSAPRGSLFNAGARPVRGRLYGPGILPLMLAAVQRARAAGLPVIAAGGIYRGEDGHALRDAGAWAVQVDTALWCG